MINDPYDEFEQPFLDMLRVAGGVRTPAVEAAFRAVPRHLFVERYYTFGKRRRLVHVAPLRPTRHQLRSIYADEALVSHLNPPSSTSQPSLVAGMLEALNVERGNRVLEIGAGTGWNAGLLGHLVGPKGRVDTMDIQSRIAALARSHLKLAKARNVTVHRADATGGLPPQAPFDRIVTTVAVPEIFPAWRDQLKVGGILVATLAAIPGDCYCLLTRLIRRKDHLAGHVFMLPGFMLFTGHHGVEPLSKSERDRLLERMREGGSNRPAAPWSLWRKYLHQHRLVDIVFFATLGGMSCHTIRPNWWLLSGSGLEGSCLITLEGCEIFGPADAWDRLCDLYREWVNLGAPSRQRCKIEIWPAAADKRAPRGGWLVRRPESQMLVRFDQ
ncbi:MAG: methyltransferase domain-containing protein [Gemmatimonadetes bacterium]|jgi:protein-L-isoaspartate(D-aspartate) O-methyltransferase|nr:methyltransferase domain-containing protein [Gemmatimonadota bacterium]MBT5055218.1 methyltransferase domain-containing protein [Gemmatimonadota bacterium]MBT5143101.1 methyltransferase domain-containing protein [Gemmatimonadota bacterium]MBT5588366.1 methyltransferase domain-containing protein [Gemmatimonadota bacterium]MBT5963526.1 methyltransferase domain-containing protein [Gemmatimonadota bacterium]